MVSEPFEACYAGYLVYPFLSVIRTYPGFPLELLDIDALVSDGSQARIPISTAHELLRGALAIAGDQDLGLKAARATSKGYFDTLEYAAAYAPTYGEALNAVIKFAPLVNEAAEFRLDRAGERACLTMAARVPMSRSAGDFCIGALCVSIRHWRSDVPPGTEVRFAHPEPANLAEYRATFPNTTLVFDASDYALCFDAQLLDLPNPNAMPRLHAILMDHGRVLLSRLPKIGSLRDAARQAILKTMQDGSVSAENVAAQLHMSRRSLSRRLATEGTSFRDLLETERKRAAKHYLESSNMSATEISNRLGFSQPAAFARAFHRWTGLAPGEYRRRLRP